MSPLISLQENPFPGKLLGRRLYHFDRLASTNTSALQLAQEGAPEGSLVLADEQSAGRGQGEHRWYSPPRSGLYCSLILQPRLPLSALCPLTLSVGIAAARAITGFSGIQARLKWPNDLMLREKKTGGILLETISQDSRLKHLVIGIGVNLNQQERDFPAHLQDNATSLRAQTNTPIRRMAFLERLLLELETIYSRFMEEGFKPLMPQFEQLDYLYGERIRVSGAGGCWDGEMAGVDASGALLLRLEEGKRLKRFICGSVQLLERG